MDYYCTAFLIFIFSHLILYVISKFAVRCNKCKYGYSKSNKFDTKTLHHFLCWIKQVSLHNLIAKKKTKVFAKWKELQIRYIAYNIFFSNVLMIINDDNKWFFFQMFNCKCSKSMAICFTLKFKVYYLKKWKKSNEVLK